MTLGTRRTRSGPGRAPPPSAAPSSEKVFRVRAHARIDSHAVGAGAEFLVRTKKKIERVDITKDVERAAKEIRAASGALLVSVPHTTAAVTVGETWDTEVVTDIERALAAWVPDVRFDHGEGNSPAHFLSEAIGVSCLVPLENGRPALGRWQGIVLIELDGPRQRTVRVRALAGT